MIDHKISKYCPEHRLVCIFFSLVNNIHRPGVHVSARRKPSFEPKCYATGLIVGRFEIHTTPITFSL